MEESRPGLETVLASRTASFPITLNNFQYHVHIAGLLVLTCDFSYIFVKRQLRRFQLTECVARSLYNSRASCRRVVCDV